MDLTAAWDRLGIGPTDDPEAIRAANVAQLHRLHPDHSPAPDANSVTAVLTDAYQEIQAHLIVGEPHEPGVVDGGQRPAGVVTEVIPVALVDDDTLAIALPAGETYVLLVEAAHQMGEVVHIEPSSGMLQVILEFVDAPACQLLLTMQGRATGVTEVFCTVESMERTPAPPVDAVARILLDEVIAASRR